ncbi:hypothetical protein [Ruminococcus sp.]
MKDRFIKKLKRSWLAIWIAFAAAALSTIGVLAAYTSVSSVKRVVSTQKGAGMLFSSNYLTIDENDLPRMITFSSMETSPCVTVNVCNYPQTMIKHNDKDITYTLTVELVDSSGNAVTSADYSVEYNGEKKTFENNSKIEFSLLKLMADDFNKHEFVLTFDKSQLTKSDIYMKVTATPTNQAELKPLSAKLGVIYINDNTSATWTGTFIDNATSPKDLDGFNYRLSGSGEGTVTLTWNTNYVDISPWFKNTYKLTISKDSSGIATATLKVNSAEKNQYDIQFYRTNGINANEVWSDNGAHIKVGTDDYVSMTFTQSATSEN